MSRKDAGKALSRKQKWAFRISLVILFFTVVGACVAARCLWGSNSANAGAPPATHGGQSVGDASRVARVSPDRNIFATVNDEEISRQQLAQATLARFGEEVLESVVNKHLILQECNRQGIVITEQDIEAEVERVAKKFGLSVERWEQLLSTERNVNRQQYRRDIIWPTIALRRLAKDRLSVSDDEVQKAMESEYGAKVSVRMIAAETRERAEQLRTAALQNPDEFGNLAKDYSIDKNSAAARGIIPPIRRHVGDPAIEQVVFTLKVGEISPVVQAARQFFVFKCERHIPATRIDPLHQRVTKVRMKERIIDGKLRAAAADLFRELQDRAKDKIINAYNDPQMRTRYPGVAAIINGRQVTVRELAEECIARHGQDVLDAEINRLLLKQEQQRRNITIEEADLDAEIARAADAFGYLKADGSPDIQAWLKEVTQQEHVTVDLYVQDAVWPSAVLKKLVRSKVTVDKEDLRKGFEANYGERVQVLVIVLGNQRRAVEVREMARANPTDAFFGELAQQYSIEPVSKANYGQVPPIRRYGGQPLLEDEAFRMKPGELSAVLAVGDKYIIMKCLGRTEPVVTDIGAVREELHKDIYEKKVRIAMADEFDRIKASARYVNYLTGEQHDPRKNNRVSAASLTAPAHR
jgi:parvulin-like peptidyl-prolyl isomerase